jgi:predicted nucleic acid-binding protein
MPLIVDASVAVKWVVLEDQREAALDLLLTNQVIAPDIILAEVRNALLTRVRRRVNSGQEAKQAEAEFAGSSLTIEPSHELLSDAFALALALAHPIYDCLYLTLARRRGLNLVTADQRMAETARRVPDLRDRVKALGEPL